MNVIKNLFTDKAKEELKDDPVFIAKNNALRVMNGMGYNMYGGTVDPVVVRSRRKKNKAARKARRVNRAR